MVLRSRPETRVAQCFNTASDLRKSFISYFCWMSNMEQRHGTRLSGFILCRRADFSTWFLFCPLESRNLDAICGSGDRLDVPTVDDRHTAVGMKDEHLPPIVLAVFADMNCGQSVDHQSVIVNSCPTKELIHRFHAARPKFCEQIK